MTSGIAFELAVLFAGVACAADAARTETRWRALLAGAFLYALIFEAAVAREASGGFFYGDFLVPGLGGAPLWVPVGWASLLYAAMRTSDRWSVRWPALVAGVLVGVVGWQLEPVAIPDAWWGWRTPDVPTVYGAPTSTHLAWLFVGLAYAGATHLGWRSAPRAWWVPFVAIPIALVSVGAMSAGSHALGALIGHVTMLALIEGPLVIAAIVLVARSPVPGDKPSVGVLVVPTVTLMGALVIALYLGETAALPTLALSGGGTLFVHAMARRPTSILRP